MAGTGAESPGLCQAGHGALGKGFCVAQAGSGRQRKRGEGDGASGKTAGTFVLCPLIPTLHQQHHSMVSSGNARGSGALWKSDVGAEGEEEEGEVGHRSAELWAELGLHCDGELGFGSDLPGL